jgi:heme exporter protein CcmD
MLDQLAQYGPYVWGAYGLFGATLVFELVMLRRTRAAVLRRLEEARLLSELAERERAQRAVAGGKA